MDWREGSARRATAKRAFGAVTGAPDYRPRYDMAVQATQALKAGTRLGGDHDPNLRGRIVPATRLSRNDPLPAHLANGNTLAVDVPSGATILRDMVVRPTGSVLWELRERQETVFGAE